MDLGFALKGKSHMPIGTINKLVHLSQQTYQPNSRLISGHNDKGYGTINDDLGREVYFLHDAVPGIHGFDDLCRGQSVEYTLEDDGPYLRASVVSAALKSQPTVEPHKVLVRGDER
jgi:cold shock CspA family protein